MATEGRDSVWHPRASLLLMVAYATRRTMVALKVQNDSR